MKRQKNGTFSRIRTDDLLITSRPFFIKFERKIAINYYSTGIFGDSGVACLLN
jgi:hypothetical protein